MFAQLFFPNPIPLAMFQKLFISLLLMSISVHLSAQVYGGQNTLVLTAEGTQSTTTIESSQLVSNYVSDQQLITMMIKTDAMTLNQSATAQGILEDVLQVSYNKLFLVQLNVADLQLEAGTSVSEVNLPLLIRYNSMIYRGEATASISVDKEEVALDFHADIPLSELGLKTNSTHAAHFSDLLTVAVKEGKLVFKY